MELNGEILRKARLALHLSQEEAAEKLETTRSTIWRGERGTGKPQPFYLRKIEEVYGDILRQLGFASPRDTSESSVGTITTALLSHRPSSSLDHSEADHSQQTRPYLVPEMGDTLWTIAFLDGLSPLERRNTIRQAIQEFDTMNTTNKNYHLTRRDAIHRLAKLPYITLGLAIPGRVIPPTRYGDAIAHCTSALEGCWELYRSSNNDDALIAFQYVSCYLPILKEIANNSMIYRNDALQLASRYSLLKILLAEVSTNTRNVVDYAREALQLSKESGDISLQISAYIKLGWSYFHDEKYSPAHTIMKEGHALLQEYKCTTQTPALSPMLIGSFHSTYALTQTKNGADPDQALAIAVNSEVGNDPYTFTMFRLSTQLSEAALISYSKGDYQQAIEYIQKRIDPDTLAPRIPQSEWGRIAAINIMVSSLLKSRERDLEKIIHHWTAAIENARQLKYGLGFKQAIANFEGLEIAFPAEKRVQELRALTMHWHNEHP